ARQKSLRSIDCIASRFDLIAQCRSVRFPEETVVITCASPRRTMTLVDVADVQRMPEVRARAADLFGEEGAQLGRCRIVTELEKAVLCGSLLCRRGTRCRHLAASAEPTLPAAARSNCSTHRARAAPSPSCSRTASRSTC